MFLCVSSQRQRWSIKQLQNSSHWISAWPGCQAGDERIELSLGLNDER